MANVQGLCKDEFLGVLRWGMDYAIGSPLFASLFGTRLDGRRVACWGGSGGSWVRVERALRIIRAAYDSLATLGVTA